MRVPVAMEYLQEGAGCYGKCTGGGWSLWRKFNVSKKKSREIEKIAYLCENNGIGIV